MSKEARSKGACWTCKLRRKKCDEGQVVCSTCTSTGVPCFGYELKPQWADGGPRQRAKEEELRIIIRELASLKRQAQRKQVVAHDDSQDVEKFQENFSGAQPESHELDRDRAANNGQSNGHSRQGQDLIPFANLDTLEVAERKQSWTVDLLEYDSQANLLMYYLDVVFPGQFPFYDPAPLDGGRGWLLLIILRTKPLYHAALSMA